jgi:hypothetical protein
MGDFYPELHDEFQARRRSKYFSFSSKTELEDSLLEMVGVLTKRTFPTIDTLVNFELLTANIFQMIDNFRDEDLNIYSYLVFSALYNKDRF